MRISDWSSDVCSSDLDGSTLRMVVTPHPFGGILLSYEDVTDRLALERSYNTLTEVQRETIDNLYEGVAVFGADGRTKLFNPGLCRIWGLDPDFLRGEPHVREVLPRVRPLFNVSDKDRKSVVQGKSVSGRVDLGGRGIIKKKTT